MSPTTKTYLEDVYKANPRPSAEQFEAIAAHVGDRTVKQIRVWFTNRRQKNKPTGSGLPSRLNPKVAPEDPDEEEILFPELVASPWFARLRKLAKKHPNPDEKRLKFWLQVLKLEKLADTVVLWLQWKQEEGGVTEHEGTPVDDRMELDIIHLAGESNDSPGHHLPTPSSLSPEPLYSASSDQPTSNFATKMEYSPTQSKIDLYPARPVHHQASQHYHAPPIATILPMASSSSASSTHQSQKSSQEVDQLRDEKPWPPTALPIRPNINKFCPLPSVLQPLPSLYPSAPATPSVSGRPRISLVPLPALPLIPTPRPSPASTMRVEPPQTLPQTTLSAFVASTAQPYGGARFEISAPLTEMTTQMHSPPPTPVTAPRPLEPDPAALRISEPVAAPAPVSAPGPAPLSSPLQPSFKQIIPAILATPVPEYKPPTTKDEYFAILDRNAHACTVILEEMEKKGDGAFGAFFSPPREGVGSRPELAGGDSREGGDGCTIQ
ncbi:hypothetical protein BOTBODRAFT_51518 [Botryobasidium botryosum FD-172 SS1]|uniref:Homeobox domain-containing protein n=1 Tax=Botryobasidium botryosum (strain FD-172 SS1) TaxID=930990 RepID=A0A067MWR5_BOTB1|nr:hypothetical protein BOTBODRAFT_51518 [Botryobasidium botryosum FD-172 SS1]